MTEGLPVDQLSLKQWRHSLAPITWSSIRRVVSIEEKGGFSRFIQRVGAIFQVKIEFVTQPETH